MQLSYLFCMLIALETVSQCPLWDPYYAIE